MKEKIDFIDRILLKLCRVGFKVADRQLDKMQKVDHITAISRANKIFQRNELADTLNTRFKSVQGYIPMNVYTK